MKHCLPLACIIMVWCICTCVRALQWRAPNASHDLTSTLDRSSGDNFHETADSPYLQLPIFQHSRIPLLDKEQFSPARGSGREPLPEDTRKLLVPRAAARAPSRRDGRARAINVNCYLKKMIVKVNKQILGPDGLRATLKLGTCDISKTTKKYHLFIYDMDQCGIVVAVKMGFLRGVLGLLVLVAFVNFCSAVARARALRPRVLMQQPQTTESQLREPWKLAQAPFGVQSQRLQMAPLSPDLNAPLSIQSKQVLQGPVRELTWKFPTAPEEPVQPEINFELQQPTPADSVGVQCWEDVVQVEVKQDFFGNGQLIEPSLLSLGGCSVADVDANAKVLIFQSALRECGSELVATEDELVYIFTLNYIPEALQSTPIVRASGATLGIECHYPRLHNVSSSAIRPTWIPYVGTKVAEEFLVFSLKLMTADWMYERPSNVFFLGEIFNIEASVKQYNHVPLRVFVDNCVATASPDVNSSPIYSFIENHGCFSDAKYTGSSSNFLARVRDDKLAFQLEAFRFQQESSGSIYITCLLKARVASSPIDEEYKACSFQENGWVSSDDGNQVCGCCDTSCGLRTGSASPKVPAGLQWEGRTQVGPLQVWENQRQSKNV